MTSLIHYFRCNWTPNNWTHPHRFPLPRPQAFLVEEQEEQEEQDELVVVGSLEQTVKKAGHLYPRYFVARS
jgi:hypothetical protein